MKKYLLLLFCLVSSLMASAESGTCGDNLTWSLEDGILVISGTGAMTNYGSESNVPWYSSRSTISLAIISDGVTSIGNYAFFLCSGLTSITIPNSVTSIGDYAFCICDGLTSITIPNSVTSIGEYAFSSCSGLTSITIPNSVTSIEDGAFSGCSGLTSFTIPNSVTSIGGNAFSSCRGLTSITIPNSVTSIGGNAFYGCNGLTSVNITDIASWCNIDLGDASANPASRAQKLVLNGTEIKDLVIPEGVTDIKHDAFRGCRGLKSVTIPNSVTSIGRYAFSFCSGLTSVSVLATTPPTCGLDLLYSAGTSTIHVYEGLADAYNAASGWSSYTIVDDIPLPQYVISVSADESMGTVSGGGDYTQGTEVTLTATPAEGYRFVRWSDGSTANPYTFTATENKELVAYFGGVCGDNLTWTLEDGTLTISGTGTMTNYSSESNVPWHEYCSTISLVVINEGATSIGSRAFSQCNNLTSISIPNSVTSIGERAFRECSVLPSIDIPNSVTNLGDLIFEGCTSLTNIVIPNLVTSIGHNCFNLCSALASVTIPNSVTSIGEGAFGSCINLTAIDIPNSVTSIGGLAFYNCKSIISISIPESVKSMGSGVFDSCSSLTSVNIPDGVTSLDGGFFKNCSSLTSVSIPNTITSIGDRAFYGCYNLQPFTIPSSVTSIGAWAFAFCYRNFTSITIPSSVTSIGEDAFYNCSNLTSVCVLASTPPTAGADLFFSAGTSTIHVYEGLADSYKAAGCWNPYNFIDDIPVTRVTSITLDDSNYQCGIGQRITPKAVTYIPEEATIKEVTWSSSDSSTLAIHPNTGACVGLKEGYVTITATTKDAGHITATATVFIENKELSETYTSGTCGPNLTWTLGEGILVISGTGEMTNYSSESNVPWHEYCSTISLVVINEGVTNIGDRAFSQCNNLTSISIPNSVTSIGERAFRECSVLPSIDIPNSVTNLGDLIFEGCTSLTNIVIPNLVTSIGHNCFNLCSALASVTIPNSVTSIGEGAFGSCINLTAIDIPNSVTSIGGLAFYNCRSIISISIPESVKSMGSGVFDSCSSLTSVNIPDGVTSLDDGFFKNCSSLTSVSIPNTITSIGDHAFSWCSRLTSVTIPNSVTSIGNNAFRYCWNLTSVNILADTPPTAGADLFYSAGTSTIHVYEGLGDVYRAASGWNSYTIVDDIPLPKKSVTISATADITMGSVTGDGEYTEGDEVTLTAVPAKGYEFLNWSDGSTENPYVFTATEDKNLIADFYRFGPEEGKVYKIRLDESDLYFAMNPNEDFGNTDNVQSAAYLTDESNATLVRFTDSGEGYIITDIKSSRTLGVANSYVWNFSNTSSNVWTMEVVDGKLYIGGEIYSGSGHRYWKSDAQEINAYLYTNGSRRTIAWILEEYSIVSLTDGEEYARDIDEELDEVTYTRTFNNTNWQALYVPFQMSYEDWADEFEVAKVNNFHQSDTDDDGVFDTLEMEIIKVKSGTLKQNHPYLIRAKVAGEKTITLENTTLYPAEENAVTCSSVETLYTFTGTYSGVSGTDMMSNGYYSMGGGLLHQASSSAHSLAPYRWYLKMESRDGQVIPAPSSIRIKVFGDEDDSVEGIATSTHMPLPTQTYDLQGRKLDSAVHGIYILNNKKVMR